MIDLNVVTRSNNRNWCGRDRGCAQTVTAKTALHYDRENRAFTKSQAARTVMSAWSGFEDETTHGQQRYAIVPHERRALRSLFSAHTYDDVPLVQYSRCLTGLHHFFLVCGDIRESKHRSWAALRVWHGVAGSGIEVLRRARLRSACISF